MSASWCAAYLCSFASNSCRSCEIIALVMSTRALTASARLEGASSRRPGSRGGKNREGSAPAGSHSAARSVGNIPAALLSTRTRGRLLSGKSSAASDWTRSIASWTGSRRSHGGHTLSRSSSACSRAQADMNCSTEVGARAAMDGVERLTVERLTVEEARDGAEWTPPRQRTACTSVYARVRRHVQQAHPGRGGLRRADRLPS
mmetsp:Transcript_7336/g.19106  ORF Transcript_7336/g.19106 Transcript_7336/m.19106 type:complete len:203 (-) Transcript_7336:727-1335(-)